MLGILSYELFETAPVDDVGISGVCDPGDDCDGGDEDEDEDDDDDDDDRDCIIEGPL